MKRWRFVAVFLLLAFVVLPLALPPALALAQSQTTVVPGHTPGTGTNGYQGLVPCGGSNASVTVNENGVNVPLGATECGLCDFGALIQRIINYLIILALPLSAALFAWAGIKLLTAGDNTTKRAEAIKIFKDVIIGLLIALAGFLVVQTVLNVLVQGSQVFSGGFTFSFGQCAADTPGTGDTRPRSTSINQLFAPLSTVSVTVPTGASGAPGTGVPSQVGVGDCSPTTLASTWGSTNAPIMSCIAAGESSCNSGSLSGQDKTPQGQSVSVGTYQINLSAGYGNSNDAHNLNVPACQALNNNQPLNCGQAFSGAYTGSNKNITVTNPQLYQTCVSAAQNLACNTAAAVALFNQVQATNGTSAAFNQWSANTRNSCGG